MILQTLQRALALVAGPPTGPRARPKAAVWLQLALVCALTACPTSHTDAQEDFMSLVREGAEIEHQGRLYWVQDPRDELCVGDVGLMMPCGDANLWGVRAEAKKEKDNNKNKKKEADNKGYTLELMSGRQLGAKWASEEAGKDAECLARRNGFRKTSEVWVSKCTSRGAKGWNLEPSGRISQDNGRICLIRDGERVRTESCSHPAAANASRAFRLIEYRPFFAEMASSGKSKGGQRAAAAAGAAGAGAGAGGHVTDSISVVHSTDGSHTVLDVASGLKFPADMGLFLGDSHQDAHQQVFMGGGAFRFFGINIYQVALYIDTHRAAASPVLRPFLGQDVASLQQNETFYEAMMSGQDPVKYSRSLYIKLLIPLKASTMKGALEDGWNMEPEAKALFLEASFKHALATRCCSKGTELLFTWSADDVLEVRLNGRMVEAFANPALAQELFANYVNDDPISPQAKKGFVTQYPAFLAHAAASSSSHPTTRKRDRLAAYCHHPGTLFSSSSSSSSSSSPSSSPASSSPAHHAAPHLPTHARPAPVSPVSSEKSSRSSRSRSRSSSSSSVLQGKEQVYLRDTNEDDDEEEQQQQQQQQQLNNSKQADLQAAAGAAVAAEALTTASSTTSSWRAVLSSPSTLLLQPLRRLSAAARARHVGSVGKDDEEEEQVEKEEDQYIPREEPKDVVAHKASRRWCVILLLAYGLLMLMSLPGSRRRFQERLRRGGGSMRHLALERSKHEWDVYLRRTMATTTHR